MRFCAGMKSSQRFCLTIRKRAGCDMGLRLFEELVYYARSGMIAKGCAEPLPSVKKHKGIKLCSSVNTIIA